MHLLLVHGSFHGPWCWEPLLTHLPADVPVTCAALTMGDPAIGLSEHVDELAAAIDALKAKRLIVVAHSYAGMVLPGALFKSGVTPLASLFLDAFVPKEDESAFDLLGPVAQTLKASAQDGLMMPPPPQAFGIDDDVQAQWCARQLKPMSLASHEDAARISAFHVKLGAQVFLRCTEFPGFAEMETRAEIAGWALWYINAGHDAMITAPKALAEQIADLMHILEPTS